MLMHVIAHGGCTDTLWETFVVVVLLLLLFFFFFNTFYSFIVPMGYHLQEIRVAFPGESQL